MTSKIPPPTLEELNERIAAVEELRAAWQGLPSKVPLDIELYCLYAVRDDGALAEALKKIKTYKDIIREYRQRDLLQAAPQSLVSSEHQSPWMDIETAPRDGVSSEQLRLECCAVLSRFVDQIDRTNMVDDHGHNFKMNKDFLDAKALIEGPRDYRVCYHHISNPTNRTSYPMQEPLLTYAEAEKEVAEQKAKSWAVAWIIARDGLVARTPPTHNSPPDVSTSHNHGEGDPSVMPDSSGGEA